MLTNNHDDDDDDDDDVCFSERLAVTRAYLSSGDTRMYCSIKKVGNC